MIVDLAILDFLVLLFAMITKNNSKLLKLFRRKGFYIDTGYGSIITAQDEAELLERARRALKNKKANQMNGAGLFVATLGNIGKLGEDIDQLNASNQTAVNNDSPELKLDEDDRTDRVLRRNSRGSPSPQDSEEEEQEERDEVNDIMDTIGKAMVSRGKRNSEDLVAEQKKNSMRVRTWKKQ